PERFRVRVINAENAHPVLNPEERHVAERRPEPHPIVALEVERINILIPLRGILRVLDRAVRPMAEPFRMLANPRMIGGALPCEIERDFEAEAFGFLRERVKSFQRAEPRID